MTAPKAQIELKFSEELLGARKYPLSLGAVKCYPSWRWWPCLGAGGQGQGAGTHYFISQMRRLS